VRRYDEAIEVRTASAAEVADPEGAAVDQSAPVAFVWRDRLYVVRGVLAHWYERRVWWREAAASALLGLRAETSGEATAQGAVALASAPGETRVSLEPAERQVWRVEAAAGRSSPVGVYDLVHDPIAEPVTGWRLTGVDD
jgi:hypothetical protein